MTIGSRLTAAKAIAMGSKRSRHDSGDPFRQSNQERPQHNPSKRRRPNPFVNSEGRNSKVVNPLKGKVRDLVRLLGHAKDMPADVRVEKERALAGYKLDLERAEEEKDKQDMIRRYHMVRFFERQKATRALKKLQTRFDSLTAASVEYKEVESAIHEAEVDLNYTMYYPLDQKYQSLYPRTAEQGPESLEEIGGRGERSVGSQRPPLWLLVERHMADGTLEILRDGKSGEGLALRKKKPAPKNQPEAQRRLTQSKNETGGGVKLGGGAVSENEDEDMSDGGFFEG